MLPVSLDELTVWARRATALAADPCPPWRAVEVCSDLVASDPSGRWVYALSKAAQELIVASTVRPDHLVVLRVANLFGVGQDRVISRFIRSIQQGRTIKMTPSVRTFVSVENLLEVILANLAPGIHLVGASTVTLADLAERIMTIVGQRVLHRIHGAAFSRLVRNHWAGPSDTDLSALVR